MSSQKFFPHRLYLFAIVLLLLTACSGNKDLENKFNPDPQLEQSPTNSPNPSPTPTTIADNFPPEIPRYPEAKLLSSEPGTISGKIITRWSSADPINIIQNFYQQKLQTNNWEIIQPFAGDNNASNNSLIARQKDLDIKISFLSSTASTEFIIEYSQNTASLPTPSHTPNTLIAGTVITFSDLTSLADPLQKYIQDLGTLGVLTSVKDTQFNPNSIITRREFARWLVTANNKFYVNDPGKQIRLGANISSPAFKDVSPNDPDFPAIQGLAEAGLISSPLRGDNSTLLFSPNTPLTRENLIAWKVPLDTRKALSNAGIDGIKETWGFQDAAKIDPKAMRSLYADYQNGEQSNIRRVFGYTMLFQPKKPVTRAEAAAALWYFGVQNEGLSAQDVLQIQNQPSSSPNPSH